VDRRTKSAWEPTIPDGSGDIAVCAGVFDGLVVREWRVRPVSLHVTELVAPPVLAAIGRRRRSGRSRSLRNVSRGSAAGGLAPNSLRIAASTRVALLLRARGLTTRVPGNPRIFDPWLLRNSDQLPLALRHNAFNLMTVTNAFGRFLPFLGHIRRMRVDALSAPVTR